MIKKGYARVTEIISKYAPDRKVEEQKYLRPGVLENAARRGKLLHLLAGRVFSKEPITEGDIVLLSAFSKDLLKITAWEKALRDFADKMIWKLTFKEKRFYNKKEKITGEVDFNFNGILVDLKTGAIPSTVEAQLGGYAWLMGDEGCERCVLHAPLGKRPKLVSVDKELSNMAWENILAKHKKERK